MVLLDNLNHVAIKIGSVDHDRFLILVIDYQVLIDKMSTYEMRIDSHMPEFLKKASSGFEYLNETDLRSAWRNEQRFRFVSSNDVFMIFESEKLEKYKSVLLNELS